MKHLRLLGLALGLILAILLGVYLGKGARSVTAALFPAALGGIVLFAASVRPAHSLEHRRLAAACWVVAAGAALVSLLLLFSFHLTQLSGVMAVVLAIEATGAIHAVRRRRFYRPRSYKQYVQD